MSARSGVHQPSALSLLRGNFWMLFGAIFLAGGLMATIVGAGLAWEQSRFDAGSREATAVVLGKEIDPGDSDEGTQYFIRYRFTDLGGAVYDGRDQVPFEVYDSAREDGPIDVEYLVDSPAESRVVGASELPAWVLLAFALLAVGIGLVALLSGWRGFSRTRRLWRTGTPAVAEVLGVEQTNVQINRRQMFRVRYRYTDASGAQHEGSSRYMPFDEAQHAAEGVTGAILYDPRHPAESVWVGGEVAG